MKAPGPMQDSETTGPEYGDYRGGTPSTTVADEGEAQNGVSRGFLQMDGKYFRTQNDAVPAMHGDSFEETDQVVEKFGKTGDD